MSATTTTNNTSNDVLMKPETAQKCQSPPPNVSKDAYCFDLSVYYSFFMFRQASLFKGLWTLFPYLLE